MRTQSSIYTHSHHTTANSCLHIEWTIISKYNSFCFKCWQVSVRESVYSLTEIRISKWLLKSILYKVFTNNDIYRFECLPATNATGCCKVYGFCMVGEWCKGRQTKWKQSSCSDRHTQNVRQPLQKNLTLDIRMTFVRGWSKNSLLKQKANHFCVLILHTISFLVSIFGLSLFKSFCDWNIICLDIKYHNLDHVYWEQALIILILFRTGINLVTISQNGCFRSFETIPQSG